MSVRIGGALHRARRQGRERRRRAREERQRVVRCEQAVIVPIFRVPRARAPASPRRARLRLPAATPVVTASDVHAFAARIASHRSEAQSAMLENTWSANAMPAIASAGAKSRPCPRRPQRPWRRSRRARGRWPRQMPRGSRPPIATASRERIRRRPRGSSARVPSRRPARRRARAAPTPLRAGIAPEPAEARREASPWRKARRRGRRCHPVDARIPRRRPRARTISSRRTVRRDPTRPRCGPRSAVSCATDDSSGRDAIATRTRPSEAWADAAT